MQYLLLGDFEVENTIIPFIVTFFHLLRTSQSSGTLFNTLESQKIEMFSSNNPTLKPLPDASVLQPVILGNGVILISPGAKYSQKMFSTLLRNSMPNIEWQIIDLPREIMSLDPEIRKNYLHIVLVMSPLDGPSGHCTEKSIWLDLCREYVQQV